jgi:hypothetical protein
LPIQACRSPPDKLKIAKAMKTENGISVATKDDSWNLLFTASDQWQWHRCPPLGEMTGKQEGF